MAVRDSEIRFAGRNVGHIGRPYVIAEIGVNHEGSMPRAKELINLAKEGGADGAKFQTYKAERLALRESPAYWDTNQEPATSQFELFSRYDGFGERDYVELAEYCNKVGIDFLTTPFDTDSVSFLADLVPFFKVASADITNLPLLRTVAATQKPVVISTGASELSEIAAAISVLEESGAEEIALLHCTLAYPTDQRDANLAAIPFLRDAFPEVIVGYSDHTAHRRRAMPLLVAHLLGASILEKHFTSSKELPGNDHYHAMDHEDLAWLSKSLSDIHELAGRRQGRTVLESEIHSRREARRSIVTRVPVAAGEVITEEHLIPKRPGTGISPMELDSIIGLVAISDIPADSLLDWSHLAEHPPGDDRP